MFKLVKIGKKYLSCALITFTRTSTDILFCDKTQVPMFHFDSKTARPIVSL